MHRSQIVPRCPFEAFLGIRIGRMFATLLVSFHVKSFSAFCKSTCIRYIDRRGSGIVYWRIRRNPHYFVPWGRLHMTALEFLFAGSLRGFDIVHMRLSVVWFLKTFLSSSTPVLRVQWFLSDLSARSVAFLGFLSFPLLGLEFFGLGWLGCRGLRAGASLIDVVFPGGPVEDLVGGHCLW